MAAYYNEIDGFAAAWLRDLIRRGLIADGEVDERSIADVSPDDLRGFTQVHFFGGVGGWSYALRLAGWPDDRPVWTGSCPCQPFSVAGKGKGTDDERHLWPEFYRLIRECRPAIVFGEQVAGAAGYGWFDGVASDLEGEGYACGAVDIPACAVNAPHIRQRLYWVATDMADAESIGRRGRAHNEDARRREQPSADTRAGSGNVADADDAGRQRRQLLPERADERSPWSNGVEWRRGADGKARRVKSGVFLLAHGSAGGLAVERTLPGGETETHIYSRVGALRGFGNAIVPQLAAEFIRAAIEFPVVIDRPAGDVCDNGRATLNLEKPSRETHSHIIA